MTRLAGRRLLITGAASGIGRATALRFAAEGAQTVLLDKDAPALAAVAASTGGSPLAIDLLEPSAFPEAVATAASVMGGLDGLVNCAGVQRAEPLEDVTPASWTATVGVNLVAPVFLCQAAVPHLRRRADASIVNVASGAALLPAGGGSTVYSASKGGLLSFTKALAAELAPDIRVNVVCPGVTDTPMVSHLLGGHERSEDAPMVQRYALKRVAQPAEIAAAILFLISAESSYITGSTLAVDGGRTFH